MISVVPPHLRDGHLRDGHPSDERDALLDSLDTELAVADRELLAMVEDVRVVLVHLASRTQTLRYFAKTPTGERVSYAQESLDIYAPLANRLGMWQLKWEIEDLSLRCIDPEGYKRVAQMLDEKRAEREMHREGEGRAKLDTLATTLGFAKADDLFACVARDEVNLRQLQMALRTLRGEPAPAVPAGPATHKPKPGGGDSGILVVGIDRLLTQLARCCKPVPPDPIRGFVTRGRGVSIHRETCASPATSRIWSSYAGPWAW